MKSVRKKLWFLWEKVMPEIDDFFVINDSFKADPHEIVEIFNRFKNAKIPKTQLQKHFGALLQSNNNKLLFRKKEIDNKPKQEFWTLCFLDAVTKNYNQNIKYSGNNNISRENLKEIASFSLYPDRIQKTKNFLMEKGIYLYFIENVKGSKIDGAVFLTDQSAIAIGLTTRFYRLDYVWFTLLHELSHIILHYEQLKNGIISLEDSREEIEIQANVLAKESIINRVKYRVCDAKRTLESADVIRYAEENNIHPALLAGIIRRDLNNYTAFTDIIENSKIREEDVYD